MREKSRVTQGCPVILAGRRKLEVRKYSRAARAEIIKSTLKLQFCTLDEVV